MILFFKSQQVAFLITQYPSGRTHGTLLLWSEKFTEVTGFEDFFTVTQTKELRNCNSPQRGKHLTQHSKFM